MQIETIPIKELKHAEYNPRIMSDAEVDKLRRSIDEFGFVEPVVVNVDNTIIGGHQRVKAAALNGISSVPVFRVNLPKNKEKTLNIALNRIQGVWNDDKLSALLGELSLDTEIDELVTGFDQKQIDKLLGKSPKPKIKLERQTTCPSCGHEF